MKRVKPEKLVFQIPSEEERKATLVAYTPNGKTAVLGGVGLREDVATAVHVQVGALTTTAEKEDLAVEKARLTSIATANNSEIAAAMPSTSVASYVAE